MTPTIHLLTASLDHKLGRCVSCMRLSFALTLTSLLLLGSVIEAHATKSIVLTTATPAAVFTALSIAHALAYALREPAPAGACKPCAAKAMAVRRASQRKHFVKWIRAGLTKSLSDRRGRVATPHATPYQDIDDLPGADSGLIPIVESSPEFQTIASQLRDKVPSDTWRDGDRNHFLYRLQSNGESAERNALFIARWEDYGLLCALLITTDLHKAEPLVIDLHSPQTNSYPSRENFADFPA
jgi:hypothetical protein